MLDAYALRKAIPRVILAVIGINVSIYLCLAAIDISNIIGDGLNQLLVTPFIEDDTFKDGFGVEGNITNSILGVLGLGAVLAGAVAVITGGLAASAVAILGLLLPLVILIALIALAVLFTLIIRQALLVFLTIISPVAMVLYVLPGTEKYAKKWFDLFLKTLLVYPIIAVIFAMSNVMAAILLKSAAGDTNPAIFIDAGLNFAQSQPQTIGTVQIIAAVLVLYAPLVLITVAFSLAGGLIGATFNMAREQAGGLSKRAGAKVQKQREDPSTFLGSRTAKSRENRRQAGFTPGSIMTGLQGGINNRRSGGRFLTGYRAAQTVSNDTQAWADSSRVLEDADVQMVTGNDDTLYALEHGKSAAHVSDILAKRGITNPRDNAEATAAVMKAKSKGGDRAVQLAAARAQFKTGTAHADAYEFVREAAMASGGNKNLLGKLIAEGRSSTVQSGRIDQGGGSFQTTFDVATKVMDSMNGKTNYTRDEANATIMDSVIESNSGMQLLSSQMKPQAARAAGVAWQRKIQRMKSDVESGKATDADFIRTWAQAAGIYENMNNSSPQNAKEFSNEFMGTELDIKTLSPDMRDKLQGMAAARGTESLTYGDVISALRNNPDFQTMRREYQDAVEADQRRAMTGQEQQGGQGQQGGQEQ